jgi:type III restriction enzyme
MPKEMRTDRLENAPQLPRTSGGPIERSMFAPAYKEDFNRDEADFACYPDELEALRWRHRNVARAGGYWILGWRKHKVYPDFIFAHERKGKSDLIRGLGDEWRPVGRKFGYDV